MALTFGLSGDHFQRVWRGLLVYSRPRLAARTLVHLTSSTAVQSLSSNAFLSLFCIRRCLITAAPDGFPLAGALASQLNPGSADSIGAVGEDPLVNRHCNGALTHIR